VTVLDLAKQVDEAEVHSPRIHLWPWQWKAYKASANLQWTWVPFEESATGSVPEGPGVYAFLIEPRLATNLPAAYPMYVGKTDRSLRQRFSEYHLEAQNPNKRLHIIMLIQRYQEFLYFYCAPLDPPVSPEAVESELIDAIVPPVNRRFSAKVSRIVNAMQR
jgi:excinuclease UvrABC nuclease subunit